MEPPVEPKVGTIQGTRRGSRLNACLILIGGLALAAAGLCGDIDGWDLAMGGLLAATGAWLLFARSRG